MVVSVYVGAKVQVYRKASTSIHFCMYRMYAPRVWVKQSVYSMCYVIYAVFFHTTHTAKLGQ